VVNVTDPRRLLLGNLRAFPPRGSVGPHFVLLADGGPTPAIVLVARFVVLARYWRAWRSKWHRVAHAAGPKSYRDIIRSPVTMRGNRETIQGAGFFVFDGVMVIAAGFCAVRPLDKRSSLSASLQKRPNFEPMTRCASTEAYLRRATAVPTSPTAVNAAPAMKVA
jgi:hypothetical protein